jgi:pilus assembly protein CpaE
MAFLGDNDMPEHVLLVDDDELLLKLTASLLTKHGFDVLPVESGKKALDSLKTSQPDIILLDVMMPDLDGFSVCRQIRADASIRHIPIIMLTALDSVENKVKGFEAGADDYIAKPCETLELVARINALLRRSETTQQLVTSREPAQTIAVYSLRGGSGVSTISANLAAALAQLWGMQVALVDMVAFVGQSALFLNQSLHNTWAELSKMKVDEIDEDVVRNIMLAHKSLVCTLASPPRPEQSELLTTETTIRVLDILRDSFPYMILDMPHDLTERSLVALDRSNIILLVTQPEIASVRAASIALDTFQNLMFTDKKIYVILNWTFPENGLAMKDIESLLKTRIDLILPYAANEFISALNYGKPPVLETPESPIGIIFEDMAMAISKESQRSTRPAQPTQAWKRVIERIRRRKKN